MTDRVRIDEHWHYRGLRALVVENSQLRLVILPELGGKLWSLVYKPYDREIFWHHPRVEPRPPPMVQRTTTPSAAAGTNSFPTTPR